MVPYILIYLLLTLLLTVWLGYLQTPEPALDPPTQQEASRAELCGALALAAILIQALVTLAVFGGTAGFTPAALYLALTLLLHHATIHRNSRFEGETCSCAPFQLKDISNHETWVVASVVAALVSWFEF
jgi:hypothetical protein